MRSLPGYVYFMRMGESDYVKIGWTSGDPKIRKATIQPGNPMPLNIIGVLPVPNGRWETWIQEVLREEPDCHVNGEWFSLAPKYAEALCDLEWPKKSKHADSTHQRFRRLREAHARFREEPIYKQLSLAAESYLG